MSNSMLVKIDEHSSAIKRHLAFIVRLRLVDTLHSADLNWT